VTRLQTGRIINSASYFLMEHINSFFICWLIQTASTPSASFTVHDPENLKLNWWCCISEQRTTFAGRSYQIQKFNRHHLTRLNRCTLCSTETHPQTKFHWLPTFPAFLDIHSALNQALLLQTGIGPMLASLTGPAPRFHNYIRQTIAHSSLSSSSPDVSTFAAADA
jgi:hypothetical protein